MTDDATADPHSVFKKEFLMKLDPRKSILIILGAASVSFLLSVSLWFGVIGAADRGAGLFVGLWVPSILALGALLSPRGRGR